MKRFIVKGITVILLAAGLAFPLASPAFADRNPNTGRPGSSAGVACEVSSNAMTTPGHASSAPGSPFNEPMINSPSGGTAGIHYAGNQPQNSGNGQAAQYDVACRNVSSH